MQIEPLLKRKPAELSGGQRQRVAIGRALVRDVDVFLFDEPLSNLDAKLRSELRVEIKRLHRALKNTMIYVTHDQIEALTLADRIAIMKSGVIQQLADPVTIYNKPRNLFVAGFIGSPSMNFLRGELIEKDGKVVFTTNGVTFSLDGYQPEAPLVAGRAVVLGVRPEHVRVDADIVSGEVHEAIVDIEEPMGADNLIWLKHAGHTLSVRVGGHRRFAPNAGSPRPRPHHGLAVRRTERRAALGRAPFYPQHHPKHPHLYGGDNDRTRFPALQRPQFPTVFQYFEEAFGGWLQTGRRLRRHVRLA